MAGLLLEGKTRAERAVSRELLRTYHGIGELLDRYLLGRQDRAGYGEQTVALLYQTLAFYRLNPILHTCVKLWKGSERAKVKGNKAGKAGGG